MIGSELAAMAKSLDELDAIDLAQLDLDDLRRLVLDSYGLRQRVTAFEAKVLARFDESGAWAGEGAYNAANWLSSHTGTTAAEGRSRVRLAKVLTQMPVAAEAFAAGDITDTHVRMLGACVGRRTRELFSEHEASLVDHARQLRADDFAIAVRKWLDLADPDGPEPADEDDTLFMSRTLDGRLKGKFDLGGEAAAAIEKAVNDRYQELFREDQRNREMNPTDPYLDLPAANRRARAFTELIEAGAAAPDNPARRKPAFNVFIDLKTFAGADAGLEAVRELENRTLLPLDVIELLRCDAEVSRVLRSPDGVVLDLGRLQRTASDDQRRALIARDGGCAGPGCDRPPEWADAHHIKWWVRDHGCTDIGNMCLLCRRHHRMVHQGLLTVAMVDGRPQFWLPDGRRLTPHGPEPSTGPPLSA